MLEVAAPILGKFGPTIVRSFMRLLGSNSMDVRVAGLIMPVWAPVSETSGVSTLGRFVDLPTLGLRGGWFMGLWTSRCMLVFSWCWRATRGVEGGLEEFCTQVAR